MTTAPWRPPEAIGHGPRRSTGTIQAAANRRSAADGQGRWCCRRWPPGRTAGKSAPAQLAPNLRRQESGFPDQGARGPHWSWIRRTPTFITCWVVGRAIRYGRSVVGRRRLLPGPACQENHQRRPSGRIGHPPTEMIEAPALFCRASMAGGPGNPLGAPRAMYLGSNRLSHPRQPTQPSTIGKFVSSGCIGMLNEDVSDLFRNASRSVPRVVGDARLCRPAALTASAAPAQGLPTCSGRAGSQAQLRPDFPAPSRLWLPPLPAPVTVR